MMATMAVLLGPSVSQAGIIIIVGKQGQNLELDDGAAIVYARANPAPVDGLDEVRVRFGGADPYVMQQIHAGLVTEEEAAAGCGASAASGSAAGLPLALAALALLARRRR
jgi:uncharacterized protein (TIGR03382 family)